MAYSPPSGRWTLASRRARRDDAGFRHALAVSPEPVLAVAQVKPAAEKSDGPVLEVEEATVSARGQLVEDLVRGDQDRVAAEAPRLSLQRCEDCRQVIAADRVAREGVDIGLVIQDPRYRGSRYVDSRRDRPDIQ